jgi:hypothetical protein
MDEPIASDKPSLWRFRSPRRNHAKIPMEGFNASQGNRPKLRDSLLTPNDAPSGDTEEKRKTICKEDLTPLLFSC